MVTAEMYIKKHVGPIHVGGMRGGADPADFGRTKREKKTTTTAENASPSTHEPRSPHYQ